jgi:hypothetical protein
VRGALVPVAGLPVHRGDDPIRRGALGEPEPAVIGLLGVLAHYDRQQFGRLPHARIQRLAAQDSQAPVAITGQRVDQPLAGDRVVPVTGRLARRPIVVGPLQPLTDPAGQLRRAGARSSMPLRR